MKLFIDNEFKCHTSNGTGVMAVEPSEFALGFFDGKCPEFIEGHRYIPAGESWTNENGDTFPGEAIFPWKDSSKLSLIQAEYERELIKQLKADLADADAALKELGVEV